MPKATLTLDLADVVYQLDALPEDTDPRGNVMASDDAEADRAAEQAVIDDYNAGNEWAWCCVRVRATLGPFVGDDYLGCCSYKSRAEFLESDYYQDMRDAALTDLRSKITAAGGTITE